MAMAQPPPTAGPSTSAMVITGRRSMRSITASRRFHRRRRRRHRNPRTAKCRCRRQCAPGSAYDEHAHVVVGFGLVACVDQRVGVHLPCEGVARFGTIDAHNPDGSL